MISYTIAWQNVLQDQCNFDIAIQMQKTMKRGQRSESNLSIAALLIVSPQSGPILRNKAYYLCCKRTPQRDPTFVNLRGTEGARAWLICQYPGWGATFKDYANVIQIMHILYKYIMNMIQVNNLSEFHNQFFNVSWETQPVTSANTKIYLVQKKRIKIEKEFSCFS